jgi:glycosyltransferase involved in cell wall biosynthesis
VSIFIARGDYIALLDADDTSLPDRFEKQVSFMNAHPEVDVLGGAILNVSESGENLGKSTTP